MRRSAGGRPLRPRPARPLRLDTSTWKPPASPPPQPLRRRGAIGRSSARYGLIIVLLALPVVFAIHGPQRTTATSSRLGENLIDGLSNGAIWALVAIGYTLVYGIIELINFAHGEVFMIGSFISRRLLRDDRPHARPPARSGSSSGCSLTLVVAMVGLRACST